METQDGQVHNDILASKVEIALTALALLAQQATITNPSISEESMLLLSH